FYPKIIMVSLQSFLADSSPFCAIPSYEGDLVGFPTVPDEIIIKIFTHLDALSLLLVSLCCRRFKKIYLGPTDKLYEIPLRIKPRHISIDKLPQERGKQRKILLELAAPCPFISGKRVF